MTTTESDYKSESICLTKFW